jgi:nucleotide-binding universal stress UspA family protein
MFKRIMIATDGSETSERAAKLGIEIARLSRGKVTSIYVVDILRLSHLPGYTALPGLSKGLLELMQKEGKEATEQVCEVADEAEVACNAIIAEGDPSTEILRRSQESDADLLILGTKGRSGLDRVLLGSVAEKVTRNSRVPVLLVPGKRN